MTDTNVIQLVLRFDVVSRVSDVGVQVERHTRQRIARAWTPTMQSVLDVYLYVGQFLSKYIRLHYRQF